jgi:MFS family permease
VILLVRRHGPETPRWLLSHGRHDLAQRIVAPIDHKVEAERDEPLPRAEGEITIHQRRSVSFLEIGRTVFSKYRRRAVLGFSLFIGQAFLYNAITFGFGAILTTFFDVPSGNTGYYFAVIAVGNFMGPLLLGRLFDTVGRRIMISSTHLLSGLLLFGTAWLFDQGSLSATTMTACWCAVLFFASAGASSAYLTVSEVFPMETRAMSIAFFYALGTAAGGISGPLLFADLTETGKVGDTVLAFQIGAALMCLAGLVAAFLAVRAERRSLEDIARPLTAVAKPSRAGAGGTAGPAGAAGRTGPTGATGATVRPG